MNKQRAKSDDRNGKKKNASLPGKDENVKNEKESSIDKKTCKPMKTHPKRLARKPVAKKESRCAGRKVVQSPRCVHDVKDNDASIKKDEIEDGDKQVSKSDLTFETPSGFDVADKDGNEECKKLSKRLRKEKKNKSEDVENKGLRKAPKKSRSEISQSGKIESESDLPVETPSCVADKAAKEECRKLPKRLRNEKKNKSEDVDDKGSMKSPKKNRSEISQSGKIDKKKQMESEDGENEDSIPAGWTKRIVRRKSGKTAGSFDVYIYSPDGVKLRSKPDIAAYLLRTQSDLKLEDFKYSKKALKREVQVKKKKAKITSSVKLPKQGAIKNSAKTVVKAHAPKKRVPPLSSPKGLVNKLKEDTPSTSAKNSAKIKRGGRKK